MPPRSGRDAAASRLAGGSSAPALVKTVAATSSVRRSVWGRVWKWVVTNGSALAVVSAVAVCIAVSVLLAPPVRPDKDVAAAILSKQIKNNRDTAASWESFTTHRTNVTSRVLTQLSYAATTTAAARGTRSPRVLVLGAGNVNDLDLRVLLAHPSQPHFHLVDVDIDALNAGVRRQLDGELHSQLTGFAIGSRADDSTRRRVTTQRVDLTAVHDRVADWPVQPPAPARGGRPRPAWHEANAPVGTPATNAQVSAVVEALEAMPPVLISTNATLDAANAAAADPKQPLTPDQLFDIVISTCVLSQLIGSLYDGVTPGVTPQDLSTRLVMAVRAHHVSVVNAHLVGGGLGLVVTDMVSSLTFPQLQRMRHDELPNAMAALIKVDNFFHGTNPHRLMRDVQVTHGARVMRDTVQLLNPWLWHFDDSHPPRTYLVYAVGWRTLIDGAAAADSELVAQREVARRELAELERAKPAPAAVTGASRPNAAASP